MVQSLKGLLILFASFSLGALFFALPFLPQWRFPAMLRSRHEAVEALTDSQEEGPWLTDSQEEIGGTCYTLLPPFRVQYSKGPGALVLGWPKKGGIYTLGPCFGVDLDYLQLDRFHNTERPPVDATQSDEEAHCNRIRRLDAVWWKSEDAYVAHLVLHPGESANRFFRVGWPTSGGVWVLNTTPLDAHERGAAIIQNAYTMDERCKAIEQVGGTFYADPSEYPDLDLP